MSYIVFASGKEPLFLDGLMNPTAQEAPPDSYMYSAITQNWYIRSDNQNSVLWEHCDNPPAELRAQLLLLI